MLLIDIEGLDGCFKETQSHYLSYDLTEYFNGKKRVLLESFPRYGQPSGLLIHNMLHNRYGEIKKLNLNFIADTYMIDRYIFWNETNTKSIIEEDGIIITDRWSFSNPIYQTARKYPAPKPGCIETVESRIGRNALYQYFLKREFDDYKLPIPDLVLNLNLKYENILKILSEKKNKDVNEINTEYLKDVYYSAEVFYDLISNVFKFGSKVVQIYCDNEDGSFRTREEIHEDIITAVKKLLKSKGV